MTTKKEKPLPPPPPKTTRPAAQSVSAKPTPPAPTEALQAAEISAALLEKAETLPVVIIPPLDPDTALRMENQRLSDRLAAWETEARHILKTATTDYTRLAKLLE